MNTHPILMTIFESLIKPIAVMALLLMMALCGCTTAGERSQIKEEYREAVGATDTDWVERRKDVLLKAKTKLEDISTDTQKIEKAGTKSAGASGLKAQFGEKVKLTQKSLTEAQLAFQALEKAEPEKWEIHHAQFKNKMNVLEGQFHQLRSMVK